MLVWVGVVVLHINTHKRESRSPQNAVLRNTNSIHNADIPECPLPFRTWRGIHTNGFKSTASTSQKVGLTIKLSSLPNVCEVTYPKMLLYFTKQQLVKKKVTIKRIFSLRQFLKNHDLTLTLSKL